MDALTFHKAARWCSGHGLGLIARVMETAAFVVFSCVVPSGARIGDGTKLAYRGLGVVIHRRAVIGRGCLIGPHVVIGGRSGHREVPVIGDRVFIGAGAKVLGPITVGDGAVIGANAVVIDDVPARAVAAGIPARVIARDVDVNRYATMPEVPDDE